jgi:hypothetical protein
LAHVLVVLDHEDGLALSMSLGSSIGWRTPDADAFEK